MCPCPDDPYICVRNGSTVTRWSHLWSPLFSPIIIHHHTHHYLPPPHHHHTHPILPPSPYFQPPGELTSPNFPVGQPIQHVARYPENKIRFFQMDQFSFHIPYGGNYTLILKTFSSVSQAAVVPPSLMVFLFALFSYCSMSFYTRNFFKKAFENTGDGGFIAIMISVSGDWFSSYLCSEYGF